MTARERLASLAARLCAALADEKQRVNLLVCMARRAPRQPPRPAAPPTMPQSWRPA